MVNPVPQTACSRCGAAFVCGMNAQSLKAQDSKCWCSALPHLAQIDPTATCLCPACLAQALGAQRQQQAVLHGGTASATSPQSLIRPG